MLTRLFHFGSIDHHAGFFNAETGGMSAMPVDHDSWARDDRDGEKRRRRQKAKKAA
jgi:hypothetical protein